jgi:hypothetical protein
MDSQIPTGQLDAWIKPTELPKNPKRVRVSVDLPGVREEEAQRNQSRLEELVTTEIEAPTSPPREGHGDDPAPRQMEVHHGLAVSLRSLVLPDQEARRIEALVRRTVESMLSTTGVTTGTGGVGGVVGQVGTSGVAGVSCICFAAPTPGSSSAADRL